MSLTVDVDFESFVGAVAGVEEICWANKNKSEHPNKKRLCFLAIVEVALTLVEVNQAGPK